MSAISRLVARASPMFTTEGYLIMSCILRSTLAIAGTVFAFGIAAPSEAITITIDDNGSCTARG